MQCLMVRCWKEEHLSDIYGADSWNNRDPARKCGSSKTPAAFTSSNTGLKKEPLQKLRFYFFFPFTVVNPARSPSRKQA